MSRDAVKAILNVPDVSSKTGKRDLTFMVVLYATAYISCEEVPLKLHAHQFRHAKASHWLDDGMNIVQISFLLGHSDVRTTMIYLDVTTEAELKAMATLEDESEEKVTNKWKAPGNKLSSFCGLKTLKK